MDLSIVYNRDGKLAKMGKFGTDFDELPGAGRISVPAPCSRLIYYYYTANKIFDI